MKRMTIPRFELCGAHLLAQLLNHVKEVFGLSLQDVHAWTDSTIAVNWLVGSSRRFKTYTLVIMFRTSSILLDLITGIM